MKKTITMIIKGLTALVWLGLTGATVYVLLGITAKAVSGGYMWGWFVTGGLFWIGISLLCFNILTAKPRQDEEFVEYEETEETVEEETETDEAAEDEAPAQPMPEVKPVSGGISFDLPVVPPSPQPSMPPKSDGDTPPPPPAQRP